MAMRKQQMQEDGENDGKCESEVEVGDLGIALEPEDSRVLELAVADSGSLDEVSMKANLHGIEGIIKKSSKKDCWISSVACLECLDQITDIVDYADVGDSAADYLLVWCCLAPVLVALRKKVMAGDNACCFDRRVNKISNSQD